MAREFMPKSSALMPYVVVNRDAAVSGVFTVDGEGGTIDLTKKYVQITDYNQRVGSLETQVTTNVGDITNLKTAVSSINGSITTINTTLGGKAAKGANNDITSLGGLTTALSIDQGGTGAKDAATARANLGAVNRAGDNMTGTLAISDAASGNKSVYGIGSVELYNTTPFIDFHYNNDTSDYSTRIINNEQNALEVSAFGANVSFRVNGGIRCGSANNSGGMNIYRGNGDEAAIWGINCNDGNLNINRGASATQNMIVYSNVNAKGELLANTDMPASPATGAYVNTNGIRALAKGRGAYGNSQGAVFGFYHQEQVGTGARGIINYNGFGMDRNWLFQQTGQFDGPFGTIQAAGSDVRLKKDITEAKEGAAERVDAIGVVEYTEIDTGIRKRGFISQQAETVDPIYVSYGGKTTDVNGEEYEILNLNDRAIMADVIVALQEARAEIKQLKDRVQELEASKS